MPSTTPTSTLEQRAIKVRGSTPIRRIASASVIPRDASFHSSAFALPAAEEHITTVSGRRVSRTNCNTSIEADEPKPPSKLNEQHRRKVRLQCRAARRRWRRTLAPAFRIKSNADHPVAETAARGSSEHAQGFEPRFDGRHLNRRGGHRGDGGGRKRSHETPAIRYRSAWRTFQVR